MSCCSGYKLIDSRTGDQVCETCGKLERYLHTHEYDNLIDRRCEFIQNICANNHIMKSIETQAEYLFFKNRYYTGNNTDAYAGYCIYEACKNQNVGRSLVEIAKMCDLPLSQLSKFCSVGNTEVRPRNLIARVCYKLGITGFPLICAIENMSEKLYTELLNSGPPNSAAAAAISVLVESLKPAKIAWACDISPSCLRRICKIYKKELSELKTFPPNEAKVELEFRARAKGGS